MKGRRYRLAVLNTATSREIPYKSLFIAEKINFFNGEDVPASHVWLLERKGIYMYWSWWFYFPLKAQDSNLIGAICSFCETVKQNNWQDSVAINKR